MQISSHTYLPAISILPKTQFGILWVKKNYSSRFFSIQSFLFKKRISSILRKNSKFVLNFVLKIDGTYLGIHNFKANLEWNIFKRTYKKQNFVSYGYIWIPTVLVCEHENASMWALNTHINRYTTIIEGVYNVNTYNIGTYIIITL